MTSEVMKSILRMFLASLAGLWVCQSFIPSFRISGGIENLLMASAVLTLIYLIVKPILKILLLPINLLSLGFLGWIINVAILYLLTRLIPSVTVSSWHFPGFAYQGILIPQYDLNQMMVFILVSFLLSFVVNFINWISH